MAKTQTTQKTGFLNSINLNANSDFPYLAVGVSNEQSFPHPPGFHVMHWHEDLQFTYVLDGEIEVKTLDASVTVGAGSGIFINKTVVHRIKGTPSCYYHSFIFPDYFLKFYFGSPAKDFVDNIAGNEQVPIYCFPQKNPAYRSVLSALKELYTLEQNTSAFYIYEVLVSLSALWLEVQKNIQLPTKKQDTVLYGRMKTFLEYMENHYGEDISLTDLADSANVSKSECLRCFKATLQTTPYKYLMEYRLSKAAELLKTTNQPVSSISAQVGFCQSSHFGKCFKEKTGCSPRDYRKRE